MKRVISIVLVLSLLGALCGCVAEKTVSHCEISMRLPSDFADYDTGGIYDLAYSDGEVIVGVLRLSFEACIRDSVPTTMDAEKLAKYYKDRGVGLEELSEIVTTGDIVYFTYTLEGKDGGKYFYMPTFYVSPYAYFVITFITSYNFRESAKSDILHYSDSVRINTNFSVRH